MTSPQHRTKLRKYWHVAGAPVLGFLAFWKDFHEEIKGTGFTALDLMRSGWSYFEIHRYFSFSISTDTLFVVAAALGGYAIYKRLRRKRHVA